ncbi:DnaD domain protein [Ureibacillus chungkukjangi]|uniref:DnaD domain-containing protein n=1 Tax=Ureibacillus chungkukjangi TaxID=1202712 RepID=UPI00384CE2C0
MSFTTGNTSVDAIGQMHLEGNIIPHTWFENIKFDSGKPDLVGIIILSEIIYWYRPVYTKDEPTGQFTGVKKRFKADLLQRSYESFSEQFGITKRQASDAIIRLEKIGLIQRHFRTITANNTKLSNVLFIELKHDNVIAMTFQRDTYNIQTSHLPRQNEVPITVKRQTNTEITTEITTKKNYDDDNKQVRDADAQKSVFEFYEQNGFGVLAPFTAEKIGAWIDDLNEEMVTHAMKLALENNALNWKYVETILRNWSNKKLKSLSDVEAEQKRFEASRNQKQQKKNFAPKSEVVPDWFHKRNEPKKQEAEAIEQEKAEYLEARRKRILEALGQEGEEVVQN